MSGRVGARRVFLIHCKLAVSRSDGVKASQTLGMQVKAFQGETEVSRDTKFS